MKTLILCGLQSSGKSTVGKKLSEVLQREFIDTDDLIEKLYVKLYGAPLRCREISQKEGESFFRSLERKAILTLIGGSYVIATGGGVLQDPENVKHLQSLGILVFLKTPLSILWERIILKGIPSYLDQKNPKESFYDIAYKRIPIYENACHHTIECNNQSAEEILNTIIKKYGKQ
jgi:shikimate kinase